MYSTLMSWANPYKKSGPYNPFEDTKKDGEQEVNWKESQEICIAYEACKKEYERTGKWPNSIMICCRCSRCSPSFLKV